MEYDCSDKNSFSSIHAEDKGPNDTTHTVGKNYMLFTEACHKNDSTKVTLQLSFFNATIEEVLEHMAKSNNSLHYLTLGNSQIP